MCSLPKLNVDKDSVWTEIEERGKKNKKIKLMKVIVYIKQYYHLTCVTQPESITEYRTQFEKILKRKLVYEGTEEKKTCKSNYQLL